MIHIVSLVASLLLVSVPPALAQQVKITIVPDADSYVQGEPILLRVVARNGGSESVRTPYRSNRDFSTSDFTIEFRRDGKMVGKRIFTRQHFKRASAYPLNPGADWRFEVTVMPGLGVTRASFEPLPPATYELLLTLNWGKQIIESAPATVRISESPVPENGPTSPVDHYLANYVEQWSPGVSLPESAANVLEQMPQSKLAALLTELRLVERWRRARYDRDLKQRNPQELRRNYEEFERDLTAHLSDPRFVDVANFSGRLLGVSAALSMARAELALHGIDAREAMDAATRREWRAAWDDAAKAVDRLRKECPEASFNEDARRLLTRHMKAARNTLRKHPDSPNGAEIRAALSVLERVLPRNPAADRP